MSDYEKIRLKNIAERQKIFSELQIGELVDQLSKKQLKVKDEIWKKLCESADKKEDFSEEELIKFFKTICSPKSTPAAIENNLRDKAI